MKISKFKISKPSREALFMIYKLLHDLFFLLLLLALISLIIEGLVPGLFSSHLSPMRIYLALFADAAAIFLLGNHLEIPNSPEKFKKSIIVPIFLTFLFLLIGNSMLKFALWQNFIITLATLYVFFLFYQTLLSADDNQQ